MKKRYFKKKEDILKGTGYDSKLEMDLHKTSLSEAIFHSVEHKVNYVIPHSYEPDFIYTKNDITYYIESKGRFRDREEATKYIHIRKYLPSNSELVFIWDKDNIKFPFAHKRKDGSYQTHNEWATKNGFRNWDKLTFTTEML